MKLLVTGGAGFIGSNFVQYWVKNHPNDFIVVLDKLTYAGRRENLDTVADRITFAEGDIADTDLARRLINEHKLDTIVHFAAESHVDRSINDPFIFTRTNVLGTHALLEVARQVGIERFHHVSTDEVYGSIPLEESWKFTETTAYHPNSPYAASKAASDHLVRAYGTTYNLPFTISNCSNNFGPYQYPEKFIPRSIVRLMEGQNVRLYSPGDQVRDWVHVVDHCRAIDLILHKGKIGETYCVGGLTEGISNRRVAEILLQTLSLPVDRIELVTDRPGHDVKYDIDWKKIQNELGWQPLHTFNEWITQTVDWYRNNRNWWEPLFAESESFYQSRRQEKIISPTV